jgi:hypothetical protein
LSLKSFVPTSLNIGSAIITESYPERFALYDP